MSTEPDMDHAKEQRSRRRRFSVITLDQALSGGSNVLTAIFAAHALDVAGFGHFGIVFLIYVFGQTVSRALVAEPVLVFPDVADERPHDPVGSALVISFALGATIATAGFGAQAWYDADLGLALIIMGALFPGLVLQDLGRFLAFATRTPTFALWLDLVWLMVMAAAIAGVAYTADLRLPSLVLAWAGGGAVAGLMTLWRYRAFPLRPTLTWMRTSWAVSWRYLVSSVTNNGGALIGTLGLAGLAGAGSVGAMRGALLLTAPFTTVQIAAVTSGMAEIARARASRAALRRTAIRLSALLTGIALVNMMVLLFLPTTLGELILGETWDSAKELLVPAGLVILLVAIWTGARAGLLGDRAVRQTMGLDLVFTPVLVGAAVAGAAVGGAKGYYWGVVAGQALVTLAWWVGFLRRTRTPVSPSDATPGTEDQRLPSR